MVHNNRYIDEPFKNTPTYTRIKDSQDGSDLIFVTKKMFSEYIDSLYECINYISDLFESKYNAFKHKFIANYYFNAPLPSSSQEIWPISTGDKKHIIGLHKKHKV